MDSQELVEAALSDSIPSTMVEPGTPGTPATPMERSQTVGMGNSGDKPKPSSSRNKKNPCDEPVHMHEPLSRALLDDFLNKCKRPTPKNDNPDDGSFDDATTEELPGLSPPPELPDVQRILGGCEGEESANASSDPVVDDESCLGGCLTQKSPEMLDLVESSDSDKDSESGKNEPDVEPPVSSVSGTSDSDDSNGEEYHTAATWQNKRCFKNSETLFKAPDGLQICLPQSTALKKQQPQHVTTPNTPTKVDKIMAADVDASSDMGKHVDDHRKLTPVQPPGFASASKTIHSEPPPPLNVEKDEPGQVIGPSNGAATSCSLQFHVHASCILTTLGAKKRKGRSTSRKGKKPKKDPAAPGGDLF